MILYLDTSALVKLYVEEEGSDGVRQAVAETEAVATSRVAYVETRAALAQALRLGRIDENGWRDGSAAFRSDWPAFSVVNVTQPLVELAGDLAEHWALRGFDATHLASALAVARRSGRPIGFASWDERLNRAAAGAGLTVRIGPA